MIFTNSRLLGSRRERKIGSWRRVDEKRINKSILFYVASVLFLIASAIGLMSGNENTMAIVWLSLGSAFLCLGSTHKKKETIKQIQMINNFLFVLLRN